MKLILLTMLTLMMVGCEKKPTPKPMVTVDVKTASVYGDQVWTTDALPQVTLSDVICGDEPDGKCRYSPIIDQHRVSKPKHKRKKKLEFYGEDGYATLEQAKKNIYMSFDGVGCERCNIGGGHGINAATKPYHFDPPVQGDAQVVAPNQYEPEGSGQFWQSDEDGSIHCHFANDSVAHPCAVKRTDK